jgi:cell division protein FtsB
LGLNSKPSSAGAGASADDGIYQTIMNFWVLIYRFAWLVVITSCVVAVVCVFLPKTHNYQTLQKRKDGLEQGNALMESRDRQLQQNQKRFRSDPAFVERVAREQGMAMPGETIFRFPATNSLPRKVTP